MTMPILLNFRCLDSKSPQARAGRCTPFSFCRACEVTKSTFNLLEMFLHDLTALESDTLELQGKKKTPRIHIEIMQSLHPEDYQCPLIVNAADLGVCYLTT